jgi:hypothetical protein
MPDSAFPFQTTKVCFYLLYINFVFEFTDCINYFISIVKISKIKI